MPLSKWEPTPKILPSDTHRGEADPSTIYMAAGSTLSAWEHLEAGLIKFFQLMCETPSFAACRAYGVIESSYQRAAMLRAASTAFFAAKQPFDAEHDSDIKALLAAYENGQKYGNNIAHGVAVGFDLSNGVHSGYFLCPPAYSTKRVAKIDPHEIYLLGASYWYSAKRPFALSRKVCQPCLGDDALGSFREWQT